MGMSEPGIIARVELPLAIPTIMAGVRTGAINIIATATIAPLVGVVTLGDFIINGNVYGDDGVLAGAILVALLALTARAPARRRAAPAHPARSGAAAGAGDRIGFVRSVSSRGIHDGRNTDDDHQFPAAGAVCAARRPGACVGVAACGGETTTSSTERPAVRGRRAPARSSPTPTTTGVRSRSARRTSPSSTSSARSTPRASRRPATTSRRTSTSATRDIALKALEDGEISRLSGVHLDGADVVLRPRTRGRARRRPGGDRRGPAGASTRGLDRLHRRRRSPAQTRSGC